MTKKIVTICGSLKFFDKMKEVKRVLEVHEIRPFLPIKVGGGDYWASDNTGRVEAKRRGLLMTQHMCKISESDAILVTNFDRDDIGIPHYIGANTFAEIIFAHHLGKKVFLLNPPPRQSYIEDEMASIELVVAIVFTNLQLKGNFSKKLGCSAGLVSVF